MEQNVAAILADTTAFGFIFELDTVKRDGKPFPNTPILRVTDVPKFDAAFPGIVLAAVNGQSIRVGSQRIGRDLQYEKGKSATPEVIQTANVEWLLGIRPSVTTTVFAGPEGEKFATEEEAKAAWLEWAQVQ